MFSALAGMIMAAKVHCTEIKYNMTRKKDRQVSEMIYRNKIDKIGETEKYEKSRLPESGYMTVAEYEAKSKPLTRREISAKVVEKAEFPKDKNMVYVPQHKFKLVKYNDPVGTPELSLPRKLNFDRQINAQGIVSGDFTKLVYPAVYYYAQTDCTSCDLFLINLDTNLSSNLEKVQRANIVNKETEPLISTEKNVDIKFIFRTLTPIDFSSDNTRLVVKEKVGHRHDGIWQTDLWVYDFLKREAKKLPAIRETIVYYWKNNKGIDLNEKRWDIYPLGFDSNNENRVVVCAYAYTGEAPLFLGTWSINVNGEESRLEDLTGINMPISIVGYRLEEEADVVSPSEVKYEAKQEKKESKIKAKQKKAEIKRETSQRKLEYKRKMHQMDMETMLKIKARKDFVKQLKTKNTDGITGD